MTGTQRDALKIVIEAVVNGASNGYTVKVDDIVTVIEGIIEKENQFVPGIYPNSTRLGGFQDLTPRLKPGDTHGVEQPKLWDQIIYTYNTTNTTSTADVNSGENFLQTGENQARQMICETKQL
jgi:hypothetical protein